MFFSHNGWLKKQSFDQIYLYMCIYIYTFCLFPAPPVRLLMLDPPYKTDLIEPKIILDEKPKKLIRARFEGVLHKNLFREIQDQSLQGHELSLAIFDLRSA